MRPTNRIALLLILGAAGAAGTAQAQGTAPMTPMPGRDGRIARACGSTNDGTTSASLRRAVGDSASMGLAQPPAGTRPITGGTARSHQYPEYDVVLEVPNLCVQNIHLKVDTVTAKVNLDARISNLVRLSAGADVFIGDVDLTIRGVRAQALLLVDLDDVYHIVDNTLTFVDNHPEVVRQLGSTLNNTGAAVGGAVGGVLGSVQGLLLGSTRNAAGQVVQRLVDQATGRILERTLSSAGKAVAERALGSVLDLPTISETAGAAGSVVRRVRDQAGKVIEFTLNRATNAVSNVKVQ
ncbi:MAG: hypothetical protein JWN79_1439 [Gemmatimonadetes bacterium]|jgi:hypothetical protein|nr:hypothetical protein [Gemmatimonadota bacterium]